MAIVTSTPETVPQQAGEQRSEPSEEREWRTIVWDDPVNLMSYVVYVFRSYFGYPEATAQTLMMTVHNEGKAIVATGTREKMEVDVQAMHSYGLWATLSPGEEG